MVRRGEPPTPKELEALREVARHGTIRAAATALCVSPHTIDTRLDNLRKRSGLRHLPQLVAWAAEHGWLQEQPAPGETPGGVEGATGSESGSLGSRKNARSGVGLAPENKE
jgi:DNA-binding CsgD family transcriptional regulator